MPKWLFVVAQLKRRLWLTVGLYCALGVAGALAAAFFGKYVPADFPLKLGSDAVDDILSVLASSMLAVATFSLATLVTAYTAVSGSVAPRAAKLLVSDGEIRNVLATFVGAFVYGVVGIVAVHTGYYGAQGRVILFFVTILVLFLVVVAMIRWIGHLSQLGQADNVVQRVADVTARALRAPTTARRGATEPAICAAGLTILAQRTGYVQSVDLDGLGEIAAREGAVIRVQAAPGAFVHPGQPLLKVQGWRGGSDCLEEMRRKLTVGAERTHDQDPLYGFRVLGEVAAKALSPGVNDIGLAREVLARTVILLSEWIGEPEPPRAPPDRVFISPIGEAEVLREALGPIAIADTAPFELQIELLERLSGLRAMGDSGFAVAAGELCEKVLQQALSRVTSEDDRRRLAAAAATLAEPPELRESTGAELAGDASKRRAADVQRA